MDMYIIIAVKIKTLWNYVCFVWHIHSETSRRCNWFIVIGYRMDQADRIFGEKNVELMTIYDIIGLFFFYSCIRYGFRLMGS